MVARKILIIATGCMSLGLLAGCGSGSGSSGGGTDATTWTGAYCSGWKTATGAIKSEQDSFNGVSFAADPTTAKAQEVTHLQKYETIASTEIASLQKGGSPDVPSGPTFVSGMTTAWTSFDTAVKAGITQAQAVDPNSSSFNDDLNGVSTTINSAFQTLGTQGTAAENAVNSASNADNNPFIEAYNAKC